MLIRKHANRGGPGRLLAVGGLEGADLLVVLRDSLRQSMDRVRVVPTPKSFSLVREIASEFL
jgi:hypothetical protein